jgi:hypothetical protein
LALAGKKSQVIGVDPAPKINVPLPDSVKIFPKTSDDFFATHDVKKELSGKEIDLAFIDGMHHFEFALRDFMNIERNAHHDSVILIHDCYPLGKLTSARQRTTICWSGDVWKLIVCLLKYRPDLDVHVILTPPTGLGIVSRLNPASTFIGENLQKLYDEFIPRDYDDVKLGKDQRLNAVKSDWPKIQALLPQSFAQTRP